MWTTAEINPSSVVQPVTCGTLDASYQGFTWYCQQSWGINQVALWYLECGRQKSIEGGNWYGMFVLTSLSQLTSLKLNIRFFIFYPRSIWYPYKKKHNNYDNFKYIISYFNRFIYNINYLSTSDSNKLDLAWRWKYCLTWWWYIYLLI